MRRKFRILSAILAFVFIFNSFVLSTYVLAAEENDTLGLYARSAVLMDGGSGRILYGKDAQVELPMASTTKIMTCIVALEEKKLDTVCTVSANASAQPQVKLGMIQGDTFYLKDLLYSLMLESHNDSAVCIAETVAGSVEGFANKMNEKAREIGCEHTYYITPNGLDAEDAAGSHHTTAEELALVMRYCLNGSSAKEEFLEITQTPSYTFSNIEGTRSYGCTNHNALLTILEGAVSGKTGFTSKAGYCYVGAVEQEDKLLIVSLLACGWPNHKGYKWVDTKKLVRYGLENFEKKVIVDQGITTDPVPVTDGQAEQVAIKIDWKDNQIRKEKSSLQVEKKKNESVDSMSVLMRPEESIRVQINIEETLVAPVEQGSQIGSVSYILDGDVYAKYPILTAESVKKRNFSFCFAECLEQWLLK